jgi:hypothetical protein
MNYEPKTYRAPLAWTADSGLPKMSKEAKKLKGDHEMGRLAKLKKSIKQHNKEHPE